MEQNLGLRELGVKWVPYWSEGKLYKIGRAYFGHGRYTNKYHAAKHVDTYDVNIFYGHVHDVQTHSKTKLGKNKTIVGQSCGCLCEYSQNYVLGVPTNWQQAFVVMYFDEETGAFTYNVIRVFSHSFVAVGAAGKPKLFKG